MNTSSFFMRIESLLILSSGFLPSRWRRKLRRVLYLQMTRRRSFMDIRDTERYTLLEQHGDIHRLERDRLWLVTGFDLADMILQDGHAFVKIRQTMQFDRYNMFQLAPADEHDRMQRFLMAAFTKKMLAEDADYISSLSLELFEALPLEGDFDLHRRFSVIISYHTVCRFLGISASSVQEALQQHAPDRIDLSFPDNFTDWLRALLIEPESGDSHRFINVLRRTISEGVYTPDQAYELLNIVWNGFMGTTPIMLSLIFEYVTTQGLYPTKDDGSDDSWILRLTDEVVRMRPVILKIIRKATRHAELGGVKIKEGDRLLIDLKTVNRDGRQFSMPDTFSIDDNRQRHLSFGAGAHRCLGMQMARHSARYILTPLRERFRTLIFIHSEWLDMETPLTFVHYPEKTSYRIRSVRK